MKNITDRIDLKTLRIKEEGFNIEQQQKFYLFDPRFFAGNSNSYRPKNRVPSYTTDLNLSENDFHLHPFLDPAVLEVGAVRRFNPEVNKNYIVEKYFEDKWVSEGNNKLSLYLEKWGRENLAKLLQQDKIKLLDIGPAGGAITTLFALRALDRLGLLDKVEIYLLDIVPDVIEATQAGDFNVPNEMIKEYEFNFAGFNGEKYKEIMRSDKVHGIIGDGETFPEEIKDMDISIVAYTHHHMNLIARKKFSEQMETTTKKNGFIGVVDFYKRSYDDYMDWYRQHFEKHQTPPPVEYPLITAETLAEWYKSKVNDIIYLENTFSFWLTNS